MYAGPCSTPRNLFMSDKFFKPIQPVRGIPPLLSRRHFLSNTAVGLGSVALAWLLNRDQARGASSSARQPHFAPKAKRVVQIFCCGGVSHIDTFDYKPELERFHGKTL